MNAETCKPFLEGGTFEPYKQLPHHIWVHRKHCAQDDATSLSDVEESASESEDGLDARTEMSSLSALSSLVVTPELWLHVDWKFCALS